jgi:hypothetical protein
MRMKMAGIRLVGGRRLQHVAEEYGAVGYGQFSALQTVENLIPCRPFAGRS